MFENAQRTNTSTGDENTVYRVLDEGGKTKTAPCLPPPTHSLSLTHTHILPAAARWEWGLGSVGWGCRGAGGVAVIC